MPTSGISNLKWIYLSRFEFTVLNDHLIRMKQISGQLIQAIDLELKNHNRD